MKIGKVYIRHGLSEAEVNAIAQFVETQFVILEKIAFHDEREKKPAIMIIALCNNFNDISVATKIPEYQFEFVPNVLVADGIIAKIRQ